ncbi:MAG: zinc ABC transporter substrate-binding protein [Clostridia bacterium]|nr:zinc ABC transporter substrate-binding protein [Clostridia bacterium]
MKRILLAVLALLLALSPAYAEEKLKIVCTSFPCYDFARAVTGGKAEIRMLIKPGSEVHSFEPAPSDVLSIAEADLFVYVGGESDVWVDDILESFGDDGPKTLRLFECIEAIEAEHGHEDGHHHEYDEHIWTSPVNACLMIEAISAALCEIDPENADVYADNAVKYADDVRQIDAEIRSIAENSARNELVFADRFPFLYFAEEYGFEYTAAFPSCAAESEPSAKTIAMLIDKVVSEDIPVVYVLELSSAKVAHTIAEESGAQIRTFHSVQNVSEQEFRGGETYVSLMNKNIEVLKEGIS